MTATSAEPGQVLSAGQPAIRLAHTGEKEAVVAIPEALPVAAGAKASVRLWSRPGTDFAARLREIAPAADPTSRTYLAKFSIPEADAGVHLGMTATVTLGSGDGEKVVRLPLSALYDQGDGPAVWAVEGDGKPVLKRVVVAGYEARDVLVASGLAKLDSGQKLRVIERLEF